VTGPTAGATEGADADDQQMAANLDTRVLDRRLGSDMSGVVLDAGSYIALWDHNGATALMPASNVKQARRPRR
jgi:D-alanyl-D-alanine carboxypeptidase/D-alanyl-D-alanine-endopeptidase (penicillin-binding protein 4)